MNEQKPQLTLENASDHLHNLMLNLPSPFTFEEIMNVLERVPDSELQEITAEYFTPEIGQTYNFAITGFETKTISGKPVECAILMDKNKKRYIAGQTVLVSTAKTLTTFPGFIRVKCVGMSEGKEGKYFDLIIHKIRQEA